MKIKFGEKTQQCEYRVIVRGYWADSECFPSVTSMPNVKPPSALFSSEIDQSDP